MVFPDRPHQVDRQLDLLGAGWRGRDGLEDGLFQEGEEARVAVEGGEQKTGADADNLREEEMF